MELTSLKIKKEQWGDKKGEYTCEIDIASETTSIQHQVSPDLAQAIMILAKKEIINEMRKGSDEFIEKLESAIQQSFRPTLSDSRSS